MVFFVNDMEIRYMALQICVLFHEKHIGEIHGLMSLKQVSKHLIKGEKAIRTHFFKIIGLLFLIV